MQTKSVLLREVLAGDWNKVRCIVNSGADLLAAENDAVLEVMATPAATRALIAAYIARVSCMSVEDVKREDSGLYCAAYFGIDKLARELIKAGWPQTVATAAMVGDVETVEVLAQKGADIDERDGNGDTPLVLACWRSQMAAIRALVRLGADVNAATQVTTVLCMASAWAGPQAVSFLIASGADVNKGTEFGQPIHDAAAAGNTEVVELLLQNGADISSETLARYPPLHVAATAGTVEVVKLLLRRGADPGQVDKDDATALERAQMAGRTDVAKVIEEHIAAHGG